MSDFRERSGGVAADAFVALGLSWLGWFLGWDEVLC